MSKSALKRQLMEKVDALLTQIGEIKDFIEETVEEHGLIDLANAWYDDLTTFIEDEDSETSIFAVVEYIDENL